MQLLDHEKYAFHEISNENTMLKWLFGYWLTYIKRKNCIRGTAEFKWIFQKLVLKTMGSHFSFMLTLKTWFKTTLLSVKKTIFVIYKCHLIEVHNLSKKQDRWLLTHTHTHLKIKVPKGWFSQQHHGRTIFRFPKEHCSP